MKTFKLVLLVIVTAMIFSSCTKEHEGSIVFWFDQTTYQWMQENQIAAVLVFYLDDEEIGVNSFPSTSAPTCGEVGSVTAVKSLGKEKSKEFTYKVNAMYAGPVEETIWEGTVVLEHGVCKAFKITN